MIDFSWKSFEDFSDSCCTVDPQLVSIVLASLPKFFLSLCLAVCPTLSPWLCLVFALHLRPSGFIPLALDTVPSTVFFLFFFVLSSDSERRQAVSGERFSRDKNERGHAVRGRLESTVFDAHFLFGVESQLTALLKDDLSFKKWRYQNSKFILDADFINWKSCGCRTKRERNSDDTFEISRIHVEKLQSKSVFKSFFSQSQCFNQSASF